jgi:hypothetical protein
MNSPAWNLETFLAGPLRQSTKDLDACVTAGDEGRRALPHEHLRDGWHAQARNGRHSSLHVMRTLLPGALVNAARISASTELRRACKVATSVITS